MADKSDSPKIIAEANDAADGPSSYGLVKGRPQDVTTLTQADDEFYNMSYPRRGDCIIFSYSEFHSSQKIKPGDRSCSEHDAQLCQQAFKKLGFEVELHRNLPTKQFERVIKQVSKKDHSGSDALVVVFMSHGKEDDGRELLCTYDSQVPTKTLWESFLGNKCPSLAGKPKLFFIQACRGEKTDKGVGLRVSKDSSSRNTAKANKTNEYVVPAHADLLVMWGSYEGLPAFRTGRDGINGSVFLHFLADALKSKGTETPLLDLLITVTRRVAIEFESQIPEPQPPNSPNPYNRNKPVPHLTSTLIRKVLFEPKRN